MRFAGREGLGQIQHPEHLAVPRGQLGLAIEHQNAVLHVVERDLKLRRPFANHSFQPRRLILLFGEQAVELDRIVPEHFDGASHRGDFVGARRRGGDVAAAPAMAIIAVLSCPGGPRYCVRHKARRSGRNSARSPRPWR